MLKVLKWVGIVLAGIIALIAVAAAYVLISGGRRANATVTLPADTVVVPTDSAAIARGAHIVDAITKCGDCHSPDLGGGPMIPEGPFMTLSAPNITTGRGGVTAAYTTADWVRTLRHGVGRDGRKLAIMPAEAYTFLDEGDLGAVIAYLRTVTPVDREQPAKQYGPIARMLLVAGQFPLHVYDIIDHARNFGEPRPAGSDTVAYGRYLARIGGCPACHSDNMAGGPVPGGPPDAKPASNLTPAGISHYTEADFVRALREGVRPGGVAIDSLAMPWVRSGRMTDEEIHAVWSWLRSLPPAETPAAPGQ